MAGTSTDFDPVAFRADIRFAMTMGLPPLEADRPTFHFPHDQTYTTADTGGDPFDWNEPLPEPDPLDPDAPRAPIQVPCAVETSPGGTEEYTEMGVFDTDQAVITLLDVDFALVDGFDEVVLGGNRYRYSKELPPLGMFEVQVHRIVVIAQDES